MRTCGETDGQTDRQTDRQMAASIWENLAFMGWTNGPADRPTECQKFCWDALNGQIGGEK